MYAVKVVVEGDSYYFRAMVGEQVCGSGYLGRVDMITLAEAHERANQRVFPNLYPQEPVEYEYDGDAYHRIRMQNGLD